MIRFYKATSDRQSGIEGYANYAPISKKYAFSPPAQDGGCCLELEL